MYVCMYVCMYYVCVCTHARTQSKTANFVQHYNLHCKLKQRGWVGSVLCWGGGGTGYSGKQARSKAIIHFLGELRNTLGCRQGAKQLYIFEGGYGIFWDAGKE
jgi:hypothetical protein